MTEARFEKLVLSGACQVCGHALREDQVWFDRRMGILIFKGRAARLTPSESVILNLMLRRYPRPTSMQAIVRALYSGRRDGGAEHTNNVISIMICHVKKKLSPLGIRIIKPSISEYLLGIK